MLCSNIAVQGFPGVSLVVADERFLKGLGTESLSLSEIT